MLIIDEFGAEPIELTYFDPTVIATEIHTTYSQHTYDEKVELLKDRIMDHTTKKTPKWFEHYIDANSITVSGAYLMFVMTYFGGSVLVANPEAAGMIKDQDLAMRWFGDDAMFISNNIFVLLIALGKQALTQLEAAEV